MWGGLTESRGADHLDTVSTFDPMLEKWVELRPKGLPPPGWCNGASAADETHLYTYGGSDGQTYYDSLYQLDINTLTWTKLSASGHTPGQQAANRPMRKIACGLLCYRHQLVLFGGYSKVFPAHIQPGVRYELGWTNEMHIFDLSSSEYGRLVSGGVYFDLL